MKDTEGDRMAGIRTLPVSLGERKTKHLLLSMSVIVHATAGACMANGIFQPENGVLAVSVLTTTLVLFMYSSAFEGSMCWMKRNLRVLCIDCEAPVILIVRHCGVILSERSL